MRPFLFLFTTSRVYLFIVNTRDVVVVVVVVVVSFPDWTGVHL